MTRLEARGFAWIRDERRRCGPLDWTSESPGLHRLEGPTGCGKTTLLRAAAGVLTPFEGGRTEGSILRDGRPPTASDVGLIPQDPHDGFVGLDAWTEAWIRNRMRGAKRRQAQDEAIVLLDNLALMGAARRPLSTLSGGEQRRLLLGLHAASGASLILADEPWDHLDAHWRARVSLDLRKLAHNRLVVVASHQVPPEAGALRGHRFPQGPPQPVPSTSFIRRARTGPATIRATGLSVGPTRTPLQEGLELDLGTGIHLLSGDNGCGKTTLLRTLFGLQAPQAGAIRIAGLDPVGPDAALVPSRAVFLFEHPQRMFFSATVAQELAAGTRPDAPVAQALAFAGLTEQSHQGPATLSAGQRQRLGHALLAVRDEPVLLMDEPTHGLDADGWARLEALLEAWRPHRCVLVASHDPRLESLADTHVRLASPQAPPEVMASIRW